VNDGATLLYRASTYDCRPCELKAAMLPRIRPLAKSRAASMRAHVTWRVRSRRPTLTPHRGASEKKVEMLFAHLKRIS